MQCRSFLVAGALVLVAACVDVPDGIRAQFAGPGPQDRSNYRPGNHGVEPEPVAKDVTTTSSEAAADAGAVDP